METEEILGKISRAYRDVLGDNLVGIYVHGSLAFGCFRWRRSDIDFIAVTQTVPSLQEKTALIQALLDLETLCPPKGVEMSVVLEEHCRNFRYPTPFELHYSIAHREACKDNLEQFCANMKGADWDLAAHFTVIKMAGAVLCGKEIASVFGAVPEADYLDSIKRDVQNAETEIDSNPVSVILNLCRVLAYMQDGLILSKEQGGMWGVQNLPAAYAPVIRAAVRSYEYGEPFETRGGLVRQFSRYMTKRIFV